MGKSYSAQFDASWEPDIFGGKRPALEAADAGIGRWNAKRPTRRLASLSDSVGRGEKIRTSDPLHPM
ncbi:MAG: hypothetical protein ACXWU7_13480, partial [Telluria sp.]